MLTVERPNSCGIDINLELEFNGHPFGKGIDYVLFAPVDVDTIRTNLGSITTVQGLDVHRNAGTLHLHDCVHRDGELKATVMSNPDDFVWRNNNQWVADYGFGISGAYQPKSKNSFYEQRLVLPVPASGYMETDRTFGPIFKPDGTIVCTEFHASISHQHVMDRQYDCYAYWMEYYHVSNDGRAWYSCQMVSLYQNNRRQAPRNVFSEWGSADTVHEAIRTLHDNYLKAKSYMSWSTCGQVPLTVEYWMQYSENAGYSSSIHRASDEQLDSVVTRLSHVVDKLIESEDFNRDFPEASIDIAHSDYASLANEAYSTVNELDINGLSYIYEGLNLIPSTCKLATTIAGFSSMSPAKLAQLFLTFYYGYRLTAADTSEILDSSAAQGIKDIEEWCLTSTNTCTAVDSDSITTRRYSCTYHPYKRLYSSIHIINKSIAEVSVALNAFDVELTLENIWDLIPFSFVVDWFVSIGPALASIHNWRTISSQHEVVYACKSKKTKTPPTNIAQYIDVPCSLVTGSLKLYERRYTTKPQQPENRVELQNPFSNRHAIVGAALVISRR